jgi:hypothetical protein
MLTLLRVGAAQVIGTGAAVVHGWSEGEELTILNGLVKGGGYWCGLRYG